MEERRVRIRDIAEELGVSTATVSNVLNGKTGRVSAETARRVQALLEERQYIPGMAGVLLAQNSSRIIGVVINDHEKYESRVLEDAFVASALRCLSAEIERSDRFMMVKRTTDFREIARFASMWNLDGLVLIGFCRQDYAALRGMMRIPFAVYDGFPPASDAGPAGGLCNISIDHFDGGRQVGAYFRRMGHQRALCVADNHICMDAERFRGFCAGFGSGAAFLEVPMVQQARQTFYREQMHQLRGFSAIFAVSDEHALELMRLLQEDGASVPGEISIVGFDDVPACRKARPALSSVRQDNALRARTAIDAIDALRSGTSAPADVVLPVQLILRESSGPAPD